MAQCISTVSHRGRIEAESGTASTPRTLCISTVSHRGRIEAPGHYLALWSECGISTVSHRGRIEAKERARARNLALSYLHGVSPWPH